VLAAIALTAFMLAASCSSGQRASEAAQAGAAEALGRVQLQSTQLTYRTINEALRDAAEEDTLALSAGRFDAAFELQGKRILLVGAVGGASQLRVVRDGIQVASDAELALESVAIDAEPLSVPGAAIQVRGGALTMRDVDARDLRRPLVHFDSPGAVLRVVRSSVIGSRGAVFQLNAGHLYVNGCAIASCRGPIFTMGAEAGELHVGHSDLFENDILFPPGSIDAARRASFRFNLLSPKVVKGFPIPTGDLDGHGDKAENLALSKDQLEELLPDWREGDFTPREMPRWDPGGLDFGARPSAAGRARLTEAIPQWLQLFKDYSAIRASASLGSAGVEDPSLESVRATVYRRIASFMTGKRSGLLARDVSAAWPFSPAAWHLRDRLRTASEALREGIPGKLLVRGDTEVVPGLAERLEGFFAQAYPMRDPNSERRYIIEIVEPLKATTEKEALSRDFRFVNPEYGKLENALAMIANRRARVEQKRDRLQAKLRGFNSKRQARGQAKPSLAEQRAEEELRERLAALVELEARRVELKDRLEKAPREISCHFEGTKTTTREAIVLSVNGEQRLRASRDHIDLQVAPEPACGFEGFKGSWTLPEGDDWITERVFRDLLAASWLDERIEALQRGLMSGAHSQGETDEADRFFRLLFQDLALILTDQLHVPTAKGQPSASWLDLALGDDGYPRAQVPFSPRSVASSSDVYRILPHVKSSLEAYFREKTMEPLFLFAEPFL
jgi:hypothetical protein